jgi:hypothetical protein
MEAPAEGLEGRPRPAEVTLADACLPLRAPELPAFNIDDIAKSSLRHVLDGASGA